MKDGRCLECGKSGHWWRDCPHLKLKAKRMESRQKGKQGSGKEKRFNKLQGTEEEQEIPMATATEDPETQEDEEDEEEGESTESNDSPNEGPDSSEGEESGDK